MIFQKYSQNFQCQNFKIILPHGHRLNQYIYDSFCTSTAIDVLYAIKLGRHKCDASKEPQPPQSAGSCLISKDAPAASLENAAYGNEMQLTDMRDLLEDEYHFQEQDNPSLAGVGKTTPQNTCDAKPAKVLTIRLLTVTMA